MRPEIKRYLDEYGARYTLEALRAALPIAPRFFSRQED